MKISICITNHNQNDLVKQTLDIIEYQYQKPEYIFVCSDDKPYKTKDPKVICINKSNDPMNTVIKEFIDTDSDALLFINGDSYPKEKDFLIKYEDLFEKYDLVIGTKEYIKNKNKIENSFVDKWENAKTFTEKLDLITEMNGFTSNFGITRTGLMKYLKFMEKHYEKRVLFDDCENYDIAMGIDALYAGLNIWISNDIKILQQTPDKNIVENNRHLIMERVRNLDKITTIKDKAYTTLIIMFWVYIVGVITGLVTMAVSLQ